MKKQTAETTTIINYFDGRFKTVWGSKVPKATKTDLGYLITTIPGPIDETEEVYPGINIDIKDGKLAGIEIILELLKDYVEKERGYRFSRKRR